MNCSICQKPVVLVPSAKERASKYGGKPSDYTKLFPYHAACMVAKRSEESNQLIRKLAGKV